MLRKSLILVLLALFTFACATTNDTGTTDTSDDPNRKTKRGAAIGAVAGAIAGAVIGNQSGSNRTGAVIGAVAGAIAGAVIGNQSGSNRTGAVIGAATGAAVGAAIGRRMDKQEAELRQIEGVEVTRPSEGEISVRMTSDILFDFNSAALRPGSRETLNELATNFSQYPDNEIIVEGHTDSVGSDAYNQKLSEQRAATVADYLIDRGVRASNVIVYGYGELRPKATNDTADGRQLNRRVEIHIRAPQQASAQ